MRRWLTIPEAARRAGRSEATIYAWIRGGHLERYWFTLDGRTVAGVVDEDLRRVAVVMQERRGRPRKHECYDAAFPEERVECRCALGVDHSENECDGRGHD